MSARALVTGGTGLVGSHVAERLVAEGWRVRVLARPGSDASFLRVLGAEVVRGDLRDPASLAPALRGVEVLHHNAARVSDWGSWRAFRELAIDGTRTLLEDAARADVARVVHMSSASVYGLRRIRGRRVREERRPARLRPRWDRYGRAKTASERIVRDAHRAGRVAAVLLRPTVVYGPRDRVVLPRLAALLRAGRLELVGDGSNRVHLVYAGDVAEAAARAATAEAAPGRAYHLDGAERPTQRAFLEAVAELLGAPAPRRGPALPVAYVRALLAELGGHLLRRAEPPERTRYLVSLLGGEAHFDCSRAERELGWRARVGPGEGLARTARWWRGEPAPALSGSVPCSAPRARPARG